MLSDTFFGSDTLLTFRSLMAHTADPNGLDLSALRSPSFKHNLFKTLSKPASCWLLSLANSENSLGLPSVHLLLGCHGPFNLCKPVLLGLSSVHLLMGCHTHMHIHTRTRTHAQTYAHARFRASTHTHTRAHLQTHTHARTHTFPSHPSISPPFFCWRPLGRGGSVCGGGHFE